MKPKLKFNSRVTAAEEAVYVQTADRLLAATFLLIASSEQTLNEAMFWLDKLDMHPKQDFKKRVSEFYAARDRIKYCYEQMTDVALMAGVSTDKGRVSEDYLEDRNLVTRMVLRILNASHGGDGHDEEGAWNSVTIDRYLQDITPKDRMVFSENIIQKFHLKR